MRNGFGKSRGWERTNYVSGEEKSTLDYVFLRLFGCECRYEVVDVMGEICRAGGPQKNRHKGIVVQWRMSNQDENKGLRGKT